LRITDAASRIDGVRCRSSARKTCPEMARSGRIDAAFYADSGENSAARR
jgi:hypothetical protein